jgi:hypothetical protein
MGGPSDHRRGVEPRARCAVLAPVLLAALTELLAPYRDTSPRASATAAT